MELLVFYHCVNQRFWPCLVFFFFHHSLLLTQFSSFITQNAPISYIHPFGTHYSTCHHSKFSIFFWTPYFILVRAKLLAYLQKVSPSFFLFSHFPFPLCRCFSLLFGWWENNKGEVQNNFSSLLLCSYKKKKKHHTKNIKIIYLFSFKQKQTILLMTDFTTNPSETHNQYKPLNNHRINPTHQTPNPRPNQNL